jgi:hypothetical protein
MRIALWKGRIDFVGGLKAALQHFLWEWLEDRAGTSNRFNAGGLT